MNKKNILFIIILVVIVLIIGYLLFTVPLPGAQVPEGEQINAAVTVYEKDPATGTFNVWNGETFNQSNPFEITSNRLSVILPSGEYYINVSSEGYDPINSLIVTLDDQSIVSANIKFDQKQTLGSKFFALFAPTDQSNNFPLIVTPVPDNSILPIGEYLPEITARGLNNETITIFDRVYDKPVIIYVFSSWNDNAQEQMNIYEEFMQQYEDQFIFYALTTIEPLSINKTRVSRGDYSIDIFKPSDNFYDDYNISTLPEFIFATNRGELLRLVLGSQSLQELKSIVEELY